MKLLQHKTKFWWIGFVGAVLALLGCAAYVITDIGDRTFSWAVFALAIVGSVVYFLSLWKDCFYIPLAASFLFGAATAYEVYLMLPTLSDIWNNVHFIGGNAVQSIVFSALFLVSTALCIGASFGATTKE
ncbi:MAG: hypothetical protein J6D37_01835 [Clostridia bacterium]|nr:hypothetical protein [Clostridia bacterium]